MILITRAEPGASSTENALAHKGWETLKLPLLAFRSLHGWADGLILPDAIALTSAHGARALADATDQRGMTLYTVGDATAETARALGFKTVRSAAGDVGALAALIAGEHASADGPILHVAGREIAGDLVGALAVHGINASRTVCYAMEAALAWPRIAFAAKPTAILFHSPRGAETFAALHSAQPLFETRTTIAAGISKATLDPVAALGWASIVSAAEPNEASLIAALDQALSRSCAASSIDSAPPGRLGSPP